jgi:hypothetical protein
VYPERIDPVNEASMLGLSLNSLTSREYHEGSATANRLGWQLARIWAMNYQIGRQRRTVPSRVAEAEILNRDGVLVVPDFLPAEVFAAVKAEYDGACAAGLLEPPDCFEDNGVVERRISLGKNRRHFPQTREALTRNQWLRDLVAGAIGQAPPEVSLIVSVMMRAEAAVATERLIGSNYIHADIHFPTIKAWLYLNDISEANGAFRYARGSHRLTLARLTYEYEASVRVARARETIAIGKDVAYGRVRVPSDDQLARMDVREEAICGRANTLVVANTMGFHRRGEFPPGVTRDMINIRFGDRKVKVPPTPAN